MSESIDPPPTKPRLWCYETDVWIFPTPADYVSQTSPNDPYGEGGTPPHRQAIDKHRNRGHSGRSGVNSLAVSGSIPNDTHRT